VTGFVSHVEENRRVAATCGGIDSDSIRPHVASVSTHKILQNMHYYELCLRREGDSDDEGTDSEFEWPAAALDPGRAVKAAIEDPEERQGFNSLSSGSL
jgi:hypothetical protein